MAEECVSPQDVIVQVVQGAPGARPYANFTGRQAADFVAAYNAEPPISEWEADRVVAIIHPQLPLVFMMLVNGGCVVAAGPLDKQVFDNFAGGRGA